VAAHLEPEILIVDEVLAVGDITSQRKCLNKMQDISHHGRTSLVCLAQTCNRWQGYEPRDWLDGGSIRVDGAPRIRRILPNE